MPDLLVTLLIIAALLLVVGALLAGGAMAMMGVGVMRLFFHAPAATPLAVLVGAPVLLLVGAG